jgi:hypothetical protein
MDVRKINAMVKNNAKEEVGANTEYIVQNNYNNESNYATNHATGKSPSHNFYNLPKKNLIKDSTSPNMEKARKVIEEKRLYKLKNYLVTTGAMKM